MYNPKDAFILALYPVLTPCEIYRVVMPFRFLRRNGWNVHYMSYDMWANTLKRNPKMRLPDILIFPRVDLPDTSYVEDMIGYNNGTKQRLFVFETDDDLTNEHRLVARADVRQYAKLADLVTVTTPYLRSVMRVEDGPPVEVLPNCIDPELGNQQLDVKRYTSTFNIALTGSPTHYKDWRQVEIALHNIVRRPNVRVLLMGFVPDYLEELPQTYKYPHYMPYEEYLKALWHADVILCPIDAEDKFNMSKSGIKALEAMHLARMLPNGKTGGAVPVATNCSVYRRVIQKGHNGILIGSSNYGSWQDALGYLLDNPKERFRLQANGYRWALKNRNIQNEWRKWAKVYTKLLEGGYE